MATNDIGLKQFIKDVANTVKDSTSEIIGGISKTIASAGDAIRGDMSSIAGEVGGHISDVVGPEVAKIGGSIGNLGKNLVTSLIPTKEPESDSDKKRNGILSNIWDYFQREEKRVAREMPDKKRGLGSKVLLGFIVAFSLLVGAVARQLILPFEVLLKSIKSIGKLNIIKNVFGKSGMIAKWIISLKKRFLNLTFFMVNVFDKIKDFFKPLTNVFGKIKGTIEPFISNISKFFTGLKTSGGLIGTLAKNVAKGFRFLGWPLQLILSTIDFVKGFINTEGSIVDKIKGGLVEAVEGFLSPLIWLFDWVGKKLGLGEVGTGIIETMKQSLNFVFLAVNKYFSMLEYIFYVVKGIIISAVELITPLIETIKIKLGEAWNETKSQFNILINGFISIFNTIKNAINSIVEWFTPEIEYVKGIFNQVFEGIKSAFSEGKLGAFVDGIESIITSITGLINDAIEWIKNLPIISSIKNLLNFFHNKGKGIDEKPETAQIVKPTSKITKGRGSKSIKESQIKPVVSPAIQNIDSAQMNKVNTITAKKESDTQMKNIEKKEKLKRTKEQNEAINRQTTAIVNSSNRTIEQASFEIPSEVDNYLLGLGVMGLT